MHSAGFFVCELARDRLKYAVMFAVGLALWVLQTPSNLGPMEDISKDLSPLLSIPKEVQLVGVGEATHGSREIFQMKDRIFRFLVEKRGFTVLLMESSLPATIPMDEYVTQGKGKVEDVVKGQGFWTWSTEELRDLLVWMRQYNLDPKHTRKLRVVGVDCQNEMAIFSHLVEAFKEAGLKEYPPLNDPTWKFTYLRKLEEAGPSGRLYSRQPLIDLMSKTIDEAAPKLSRERLAMARQVGNSYAQFWSIIEPEYLREDRDNLMVALKGDSESLSKALQGAMEIKDLSAESRSVIKALMALQGSGKPTFSSKDLRVTAKELESKGGEHALAVSLLQLFAINLELSTLPKIPREPAMAANTRWALKTYLPGQKAMIWAHNSHIGTTYDSGKPLMLGAYLKEDWGSKYFPIGIAFGSGGFNAVGSQGTIESFEVGPPKEGSFDLALSQAGKEVGFLNFDKANEETKRWLSLSHPWRNIGSSYYPTQAERFYEPLKPRELFRGLVFLNKVTPSRLLK